MKSLNTRKKVVFIISIAFCIIIVSIAVFAIYRINHPVYTFDEITNNLFSQYDHTKMKDDKSKAIAERIIKRYSTYAYTPYSGSLGNTAHTILELYDVNDNLLFILTDIGNREIIQITIDGNTKTYQGNN